MIEGFPVIVILPKQDITIIIPYSLKKRKINNRLLISILNPLISSLSPSSRSKGARFVSIRENRIQIV
jgi:hypothetical protein